MTLHKFLMESRFVQSQTDPTLFVWSRYGALVTIVVNMDDILMLSESNASLSLVAEYFKESCEARKYTKIEKFLVFSVQN